MKRFGCSQNAAETQIMTDKIVNVMSFGLSVCLWLYCNVVYFGVGTCWAVMNRELCMWHLSFVPVCRSVCLSVCLSD